MLKQNKLKWAFCQKLLCLAVLLGGVTTANAQMRVGGNMRPDDGAILDLNPTGGSGVSDRGILLPRVQLVATDNTAPLKNSQGGALATHPKGMYVYNVAAAGTGATAVTEGIYYNDGTQWVKVLASGNISMDDLPTTFITNLGDELLLSSAFVTNLGDSIMLYIAENLNSTTINLGDTIIQNMFYDDSKLQILIDSLLSKTNAIDTIFNETISKEENIITMTDSIAHYFYQTDLKDSIVNLMKDSVKVKQLIIPLNEVIGTQSKYFTGATAATGKPIEIVGIEPQLTGDFVMRVGLLKVNSLTLLNGGVVEWSVAIENDNIDTGRTCMLTNVIVSYICADDLVADGAVGVVDIVGR